MSVAVELFVWIHPSGQYDSTSWWPKLRERRYGEDVTPGRLVADRSCAMYGFMVDVYP